MRRHAFTLIECLVVIAIFATLCAILAPLFVSLASIGADGPPKTIQMVTVQHDDHWWVMCRESFTHHPDCPCRYRKAEK